MSGCFAVAKKDRIVWKKAWKHGGFGYPAQAVIVRLLLKKGTKYWRTNASARYDQCKCRAPKLKVLGFETLTGHSLPDHTTVRSDRCSWFYYRVGETVKPDRPFSMEEKACGSGIHFFRTREQAVAYTF